MKKLSILGFCFASLALSFGCQSQTPSTPNLQENYVSHPVTHDFRIKAIPPQSLTSHLSDLQALLDGDSPQTRISPANNMYSSDKLITWPEDGIRSNATVCTALVSLSLKHSYGPAGLSEAAFKGITGGASFPYPWEYYEAFQNQPIGMDPVTQTQWQFQRVLAMSDLLPGDLMTIDYMDANNGCSKDNAPNEVGSSSSATGHTAVIESLSAPVVSTLPGTAEPALRYDIVVLDSSSSYHGKTDTRYLYPQSNLPFEPDQGLGRGTMRFYANPQTGAVIGHKWSTNTSTTCRPEQRRVAFGRLHQL